MHSLSRLAAWNGRSPDPASADDWLDLLDDFGPSLARFLVDPAAAASIPEEDPWLADFRHELERRPLSTFKPHRGSVWVLFAYGGLLGGLSHPFFRDGLLLPLEWRKEGEGSERGHSRLLPDGLADLAERVKRQFSASGLDVAPFFLHPSREFADKVDFRMEGATFDSAWGALATGLLSMVDGKASFAEWPFSSVAFGFETGMPRAVSGLAEKFAIARRFGAEELAVAPVQFREAVSLVRESRLPRFRIFHWRTGRGAVTDVRRLLRCNQIRKRNFHRLMNLLVGCLIVLGATVLLQMKDTIRRQDELLIVRARIQELQGRSRSLNFEERVGVLAQTVFTNNTLCLLIMACGTNLDSRLSCAKCLHEHESYEYGKTLDRRMQVSRASVRAGNEIARSILSNDTSALSFWRKKQRALDSYGKMLDMVLSVQSNQVARFEGTVEKIKGQFSSGLSPMEAEAMEVDRRLANADGMSPELRAACRVLRRELRYRDRESWESVDIRRKDPKVCRLYDAILDSAREGDVASVRCGLEILIYLFRKSTELDRSNALSALAGIKKPFLWNFLVKEGWETGQDLFEICELVVAKNLFPIAGRQIAGMDREEDLLFLYYWANREAIFRQVRQTLPRLVQYLREQGDVEGSRVVSRFRDDIVQSLKRVRNRTSDLKIEGGRMVILNES